ncbi:c-type cytochrome [Flavihumibacter sp. CACIAM 22H1]|uniref:c-type cytochrome n=1 Tax=Flavihumibacter sp. CACIAM 22H1 TaxID=1812911 RepID=UPI0007A8184D|nr:c-type cytochrome [Flavihumibacter sp. CACIAM 22H1]KYP16079.1 MAG: cytochrome c class I [Flavihumibacter sp. CACIAM 22H1]
MKKYVILAGISAIAFACGNQAAEEKKADAPATEQAATAGPSADEEKGIELIAGSDCLTCHKVNEKAIGPSYQDVANKYTANDATIAELAGKIIKGGSGVWGEVPMTPHPQVSEDDAKTMVKYILSLKTK